MGLIFTCYKYEINVFKVCSFQLFSFHLLGINFMLHAIILENENFAVDCQVNE